MSSSTPPRPAPAPERDVLVMTPPSGMCTRPSGPTGNPAATARAFRSAVIAACAEGGGGRRGGEGSRAAAVSMRLRTSARSRWRADECERAIATFHSSSALRVSAVSVNDSPRSVSSAIERCPAKERTISTRSSATYPIGALAARGLTESQSVARSSTHHSRWPAPAPLAPSVAASCTAAAAVAAAAEPAGAASGAFSRTTVRNPSCQVSHMTRSRSRSPALAPTLPIILSAHRALRRVRSAISASAQARASAASAPCSAISSSPSPISKRPADGSERRTSQSESSEKRPFSFAVDESAHQSTPPPADSSTTHLFFHCLKPCGPLVDFFLR
mmetsp:Transcript_7388/g.19358  ORF Transcript_7388/g.19358 Transcript_7388/m.19358 type:complete len:331 (-) Transcript_7388:94-1086(-)